MAAASINSKNLFITFYLLDDDELAAERDTLLEERELLPDEYELRLGEDDTLLLTDEDEEEDDLLLTDEGAELRVYDEREPLEETVLMRVLLEPDELTLLRMVVCGRELVVAALRLVVVLPEVAVAALRDAEGAAALEEVLAALRLVVVLPEVVEAALRLVATAAELVVVAALRLVVPAAVRLDDTDVAAARDALTVSRMSRALVAARDVPCAVLLCTGMSAVRLENSLSGCCTA